MNFFPELKRRNALLYWFGWYNLLAGIVCIILLNFDTAQVLGINRWIKPIKFFLSVGIMIWTMGWLLYYLEAKKSVKLITWLFIITMFVENAIISFQSIRGQQSHFNISSPFNAALFSIMGTFIILFAFTCIYALILFFRQKLFIISPSYYWGIRLGLLLFIIFSLEGGMMVGLFSHTVGGRDGGPGLPFVNWSNKYGDLRVAHFMGLHSLQILPLVGYYLAKSKKQILIYSTIYFVAVMALFVQALRGIPLFF